MKLYVLLLLPTLCREMALGTEQASLGAPSVGARQTIWVEMPFEPKRADAIIQ
jgi:hypothetical protein